VLVHDDELGPDLDLDLGIEEEVLVEASKNPANRRPTSSFCAHPPRPCRPRASRTHCTAEDTIGPTLSAFYDWCRAMTAAGKVATSCSIPTDLVTVAVDLASMIQSFLADSGDWRQWVLRQNPKNELWHEHFQRQRRALLDAMTTHPGGPLTATDAAGRRELAAYGSAMRQAQPDHTTGHHSVLAALVHMHGNRRLTFGRDESAVLAMLRGAAQAENDRRRALTPTAV
jgi:hypothetical protein